MRANETPRGGYERRSITLPASPTRRDVWDQLATLPGLVAVHLIGADGRPTLLSDDAIDTALSTLSPPLEIDALSEAQYMGVTVSTVQQALATANSLRGTLRTQTIAATTEELQAFCGRLNAVVAMVSLSARPRADQALMRPLARLSQQAQQLATSAFQLDDTVRAMDDLHYEIAPTLTTLLSRLGLPLKPEP